MGLCKLAAGGRRNMKTKKITQDKVVYFLNYIFLTLMLIIVLYLSLIHIYSDSEQR